MQCPRCRQENPPQAKFCLECVTPLALACARGGTRLPAAAKFCPECSHPAGPAPETASRFPSAETYTLGFHGIAAFLGSAYVLAGRPADALPLLERVVEQTRSMGVIFDHLLGLVPLSEAYLAVGRTHQAKDLAIRGLELARQHKERAAEAWALRAVGETTSSQNPPEVDVAERHYRQALTLADELGLHPLMAHCHFGLGKLYRSLGHEQKAQEDLTKAAALLSEMNMRLWLEGAEAELAGATRSGRAS